MTTPGPFSKPPARPTPPVASEATPKKVEQASVLNSDVSSPVLAILAPVLMVVLTILSPVLGWLGRLKRWQAWLLGVTVAFIALVVVANLNYDPKKDQGARDYIGSLVTMCSESAKAREYWTADERFAWTRRCVSRIQGGASIPSVLTTD